MEIKRVTRHTLPTKFDIEPFGTLCCCFGDDKYDMYVQISRKAEPEWVPFTVIFERIFSAINNKDEFQLILLELLNDNNKENMLRFIKYIQEIYLS